MLHSYCAYKLAGSLQNITLCVYLCVERIYSSDVLTHTNTRKFEKQ